jgi:hypothetical protein
MRPLWAASKPMAWRSGQRSSEPRSVPQRLSLSDAQPALLVSRTLWLLPRTITSMVPETSYSLL